MNRNRQFDDLIHDIRSNAPKDLDTSVRRVMTRAKKRRRFVNLIRIPAAAIVTLILSFTVLVNTNAVFARAMGEVPALKELAKFVAADPSLKAAVKNKYVQPVGQAVTRDGVTVNIGYVIADEQRLSAFFNIEGSEPNVRYGVGRIDLSTMDGAEIPSMMSWGYPETEMQEARFDLADGERLPGDVRLTIRICLLPSPTDQNEPPPAERIEDDLLSAPEQEEVLPGEWVFDLHLDPALIAQGQINPINEWVEIAGQRLHLISLTIYPTQAKLKFETDQRNTAFVSGLDAWIEDDRGKVWARRKNGIVATSDEDSHEKKDIWMESSYFTPAEQLTLHIGRAALIPKDMADVTVDYAAGTVSPLPPYIKLVSMTPMGEKLRLSFDVNYEEGDPCFNPFSSTYHNVKGQELSISTSILHTNEDDSSGKCEFAIEDYHDPVTLKLISVPLRDIEPIEIKIK